MFFCCVELCCVCLGPSAGKPGEGGGRGNFSFFLLKIGNRKQDPSFVILVFSTLKYFSDLGLLLIFSEKGKVIILPSKLVLMVCCPLLAPIRYGG